MSTYIMFQIIMLNGTTNKLYAMFYLTHSAPAAVDFINMARDRNWWWALFAVFSYKPFGSTKGREFLDRLAGLISQGTVFMEFVVSIT
jgi:hypothetical protein